VLISTLAWSGAHAADPRSQPQRNIPARGVVAYLEYEGLDAHAEAWKATAARAMLNDTPAGKMLSEVTRQVLDRFLKDLAAEVPNAKVTGADLVGLQDELVRRGFAMAVMMKRSEPDGVVVVLNGFGRKEPRARLERLMQFEGGLPRPTRIRGRDVYQDGAVDKQDAHKAEGGGRPGATQKPKPAPAAGLVPVVGPEPELEPAPDAEREKPALPTGPSVSMWYENEDLLILFASAEAGPAADEADRKQTRTMSHKEYLDLVLDVIEQKKPNITTHPGYKSALDEGRDLKGFEANGLLFIDPSAASLRVADMAGGLAGAVPFGAGLLGDGTTSVKLSIPSLVKGQAPLSIPLDGLMNRARQGPRTRGEDELGVPVKPAVPASPLYAIGDVPAGAPALPPPADGDGASKEVAKPAKPSDEKGKPAAPAEPVVRPSPSARQTAEPREVALGEQRKPDQAAIDGLEVLGLYGIKRLVGRWGFQGKALTTDVRIEAPGPRKSLLSVWFDQPAFSTNRLPPLPRTAREFTVAAFEPETSYQLIRDAFKAIDPEVEAAFKEAEQTIKDQAGLRLREDFLRLLGPTWTVIRLVPEGGASRSSKEFDPTEYVLVAGVKDAAAFGAVLDRSVALLNASLRKLDPADEGADGKKANDAEPPALAVERLPGPDRGYRLTSPAGIIPWLNTDTEPTILLGKSYIAIAADTDRARAVLAAEGNIDRRWRPEGEVVSAFDGLPANLTFLSIGDERNSIWPDGLAHLPATAQYLLGLLDVGTMPDAAASAPLLAFAGIPRPGAFRLRIGPSGVPKAKDLRSHLFPSVLAATVDARGLRIIGREAFPFACVSFAVKVNSKR
jgi:hypothetical protein